MKLYVELIDQSYQWRPLLEFKPRATPIAKRWFEEITWCTKNCKITYPDRFYNFSTHRNVEWIQQQLNQKIQEINQYYRIDWPDTDNWQEKLNHLHWYFAEYRENDIAALNDDVQRLFDEFNLLIHRYEDCMRNQVAVEESGHPNAQIILNWTPHRRHELKKVDYRHFTIKRQFGTIYVNYCQIGKHIMEMFYSQDEVLDPKHIKPLRHYSGDSVIWLGRTTGEVGEMIKLKAVQSWFEQHKSIFDNLGLQWGDHKLALGWIPVADLDTTNFGWSDPIDAVNMLTESQCIHKVWTE